MPDGTPKRVDQPAPAGTETTSPLDIVAATHRLGGDFILLHQLMDIFLEDHGQPIEALRAAAHVRDGARVAQAVSTLKGSAQHLVASRVTGLATRIETSCKSGDLDLALSLVPPFEHEVGLLVAALRAERQSAP